MYAVVKTGGKQDRVAPDDGIRVAKLDGDEGDVVTLPHVLMVGDGDAATIGEPVVDGAAVAAEILEQGRGEKIIVFKKRRRQNYRRKKGHRQHLTTLRITEILTGGAAAKAPEAAKARETAKTPGADAAPAVEEAAPALLDARPENADDLTRISGVGPKLAETLNELGVFTFEQIAEWTPENVAFVDARLKFKGRIERDDWIGEAKKLAAEKS